MAGHRQSRRLRSQPASLRQRAVPFAACMAVLVAAGCLQLGGARLYREGSEALVRGDALLAVQRLERAAQIAPQVAPIHNHLGLAYAALGRRSEARDAFERAVALDCSNDPAVRNLAIARAEQWAIFEAAAAEARDLPGGGGS